MKKLSLWFWGGGSNPVIKCMCLDCFFLYFKSTLGGIQGKPKKIVVVPILYIYNVYFLCILDIILLLFDTFAGWNAPLPVQIKDFSLILLRTHCTHLKSKTKNRNIKKKIRNLSQVRAGKKPNQRDTDCILTNLVFGLGEESATLLPGTGASTGTRTQRIRMKSDPANNEKTLCRRI